MDKVATAAEMEVMPDSESRGHLPTVTDRRPVYEKQIGSMWVPQHGTVPRGWSAHYDLVADGLHQTLPLWKGPYTLYLHE